MFIETQCNGEDRDDYLISNFKELSKEEKRRNCFMKLLDKLQKYVNGDNQKEF